MLRIGVDAMGGDFAPEAAVRGAVMALEQMGGDSRIVLFGDRDRILKGVWGENYFGDVKIVDVNIRRLRMKVEDEPSHPAHILTVWGYGYRWEE